MEWYEHRHDEDTRQALCPETPEMSPARRLALRLGHRFGGPHCHLLRDPAAALHVALEVLFAPELGERAARVGDEIMVISTGEPASRDDIAACGGSTVLLAVSPENGIAEGAKAEALLSMSTRAILVEHDLQCLKNLHTVRNFCNKYDLWLLEFLGDAWDVRYQIGGKSYAVGAIGDWSVCDLARLGICGAAILTRDDVLSSLIGAAAKRNAVSLSDEVAARALQKLSAGGDGL